MNQAHVLAARAVGSTLIDMYVKRLLLIVVVFFGLLNVIDIILIATHSAWWALLLTFSLPLFTISLILLIITQVVINSLRPRKLTRSEKKRVKQFIHKVEATYVGARTLKRTPTAFGFMTLLAFLRGGRKRAAEEVISPITDATDLKKEFDELTKLF